MSNSFYHTQSLNSIQTNAKNGGINIKGHGELPRVPTELLTLFLIALAGQALLFLAWKSNQNTLLLLQNINLNSSSAELLAGTVTVDIKVNHSITVVNKSACIARYGIAVNIPVVT